MPAERRGWRAGCEALRTALELAPVGVHAVSAGKTVLQDGHAVNILIEPVENATDKRSAPLLCCRVADAGSSETISPRWPGALPHPPSVRLGLRLLRRKYPVPMLRAGTGLSQQDAIPRQGAPQKGTEVAGGCPTAWNRRLRMADQTFRRPKSGAQLEYC